MVLPVAVEIAPPDAPKEHVAVLLSACSRAKRDGVECLLAADAPAGGSSAVAIITWQGSSRALVEVGLRREGRPEWRSRSLDFAAARDDVIERWRAVGLVVGTMANEQLEEARPAEAQAEPEPEPEPAPAPTPVPLPRATEPGKRQRATTRLEPAQGRIDLGAAVGPALAALRFGGLLRGELRLPDPLRIQLTARYLERPSGERQLRAQWITASLGLGVGFGSEQFEFGVAVDGRGEYFGARAEQQDDAEARTRWLSGIGLGATVAWMPSASLGLFVGGDSALMFGSTEIRIADDTLGQDGAVRYAGEAGVRFRLR
jgi:hypothetical protein